MSMYDLLASTAIAGELWCLLALIAPDGQAFHRADRASNYHRGLLPQ